MGAFKSQTRPYFIYLRIVRYCDHEPILLFVVTNHRLRIHPLPAGDGRGEGEPPRNYIVNVTAQVVYIE